MPEKLLLSGTTASEIQYYIYEEADGSVFAETLTCRYCPIAQTVDEFKRMPTAELERKIYNAEMSAAR